MCVACMVCLPFFLAGIVVVMFDSAAKLWSWSRRCGRGKCWRGNGRRRSCSFQEQHRQGHTMSRTRLTLMKALQWRWSRRSLCIPTTSPWGSAGLPSPEKGEGAMSILGFSSSGHHGVAKPTAGISKSGKSHSKLTEASMILPMYQPDMPILIPSGLLGRQSLTESAHHLALPSSCWCKVQPQDIWSVGGGGASTSHAVPIWGALP